MTPLQRYERDLLRDGFVVDAAQRRAVAHTQRLYQQLQNGRVDDEPAARWLDRLLKRAHTRTVTPTIKGLYFWGGVGRGKTYIVDALYDCLPADGKLRMHFHGFMQRVHRELRELRQIESPLRRVADGIAGTARILCFDEFHVSDITDAMLLGGLLQELFARRVTLVATSNDHPDQLYHGGLQRERFLPAIRLIKAHTEIVQFDGDTDYRLRALEKAEIFHCPLDDSADASLSRSFEAIAPDAGEIGGAIEIEGRPVTTVRHADGVVWFDFKVICEGLRAAADYIEIACCYQTVLVSNVPRMDDFANDAARRFIHLVDELYDRNVKLIVSAAAAPTAIYSGKKLARMFERTASRLQEMQSHDYLARPHISG
jgi:cell division protein ZapE